MKKLLTVLTLVLSATAIAQVNEEAYEATAALIQLPASISGSVILRECDRCEPKTLRVTSSTQYLVNGTATTLDRLRALQANAREAGGVYAVGYSVDTGFTTWIALDY